MSGETEYQQEFNINLDIIHKHQCLDLCKECCSCLVGNTYALQVTCLHSTPNEANCAVIRNYYDRCNT